MWLTAGQQEVGLLSQDLSCSVVVQDAASLSGCTEREVARFFFGSCTPFSQPGQSMGMGAFWQRARGEGGEWTSGMHLLRRVPEVCTNADSFAV